jgi:hypothetical protein
LSSDETWPRRTVNIYYWYPAQRIVAAWSNAFCPILNVHMEKMHDGSPRWQMHIEGKQPISFEALFQLK